MNTVATTTTQAPAKSRSQWRAIIKRTVPILLLISLCLCCSFIPKGAEDCLAFKNGRFSIKSELDKQSYLIDRKDSFQVETNLLNGRVTKWRVAWLSPCRYELWYLPEKAMTKEDSF